MIHNVYLYILIMAAVTYGVRTLPLLFLRHEIQNKTIRAFFYYVPYATLTAMTFPAILDVTGNPVSGFAALLAGCILAWRGGNLLNVAVLCCITTYICEKILIWL